MTSGILALAHSAINPRRLCSCWWRNNETAPACAIWRGNRSHRTATRENPNRAGSDSVSDSVRRRRSGRHQQSSRDDCSSGMGQHEHTLVNALLHHCSMLSGIGGKERPGIVHVWIRKQAAVLSQQKMTWRIRNYPNSSQRAQWKRFTSPWSPENCGKRLA